MPKIHVTAWEPELMYPGKDQRVAAIDPEQWGAGAVAQQLLEMTDNVHAVQSISFPTQGFEVDDDLFDRFVSVHSDTVRVLEPEDTDEEPTLIPADTAAQHLVESARSEADQIIAEAKEQAAALIAEAQKEAEPEGDAKTEKASKTTKATKTQVKE